MIPTKVHWDRPHHRLYCHSRYPLFSASAVLALQVRRQSFYRVSLLRQSSDGRSPDIARIAVSTMKQVTALYQFISYLYDQINNIFVLLGSNPCDHAAMLNPRRLPADVFLYNSRQDGTLHGQSFPGVRSSVYSQPLVDKDDHSTDKQPFIGHSCLRRDEPSCRW